MIPIRCFTCNKILGQYFFDKESILKNPEDFFNQNDINRYCCRKIILNHVDIFVNYEKPKNSSFYSLKKNIEQPVILLTD